MDGQYLTSTGYLTTVSPVACLVFITEKYSNGVPRLKAVKKNNNLFCLLNY